MPRPANEIIRSAVDSDRIDRAEALSAIVEQATRDLEVITKQRSGAALELGRLFTQITRRVCEDKSTSLLTRAACNGALAQARTNDDTMSLTEFERLTDIAYTKLSTAADLLRILNVPVLCFKTEHDRDNGVTLREYAANRSTGAGLEIVQEGDRIPYHLMTIEDTVPRSYIKRPPIVRRLPASDMVNALTMPQEVPSVFLNPEDAGIRVVIGDAAIQSFFNDTRDTGIPAVDTLLGATFAAGIHVDVAG